MNLKCNCGVVWMGTRLNALLAGWMYKTFSGVGQWFCPDCKSVEEREQ